jgi:membrane protein implicated in regulation of membrane protease activity
VILILLLMIASLVLVFLGLATDITIRTQGTSLLTHMVLTYAGLLVTLLSHMAAFLYIMGLRKLLLTPPPDEDSEEANIPAD